jgi:L-histidine N-alpha-methyltransferase
MARDVREGLLSNPRTLPSKYFYDERGSGLFEDITRLPEYYPTRSERALLEASVREIADISRPCTLVELGAGNADKTRVILNELLRTSTAPVTYVPVDVSADFLEDSAEQLRSEYPALRTTPVVADFSHPFKLPTLPEPTLHAFLGSTIGNFSPDLAVDLLAGVQDRMARDDYFLLGVDLRKDRHVIERAYNDNAGVTAEFNRNILHVINSCLGANFNASRFEHSAIYNEAEHRIEMRLVARGMQHVVIPDVGDFLFEDGDAIITEFSYKYSHELVEDLLSRSGLRTRRWFTDADASFGLALASL